jgi:hypothetical protein
MEALLEIDTPTLSVFNSAYYENARNAKVINTEVNTIAKSWLSKLPANAKYMVNDGGAAGDTASVGVGFINAGKSVSACGPFSANLAPLLKNCGPCRVNLQAIGQSTTPTLREKSSEFALVADPRRQALHADICVILP